MPALADDPEWLFITHEISLSDAIRKGAHRVYLLWNFQGESKISVTRRPAYVKTCSFVIDSRSPTDTTMKEPLGEVLALRGKTMRVSF